MLADRLERALADEVKPLALTMDERAMIRAALEDPPDGLAELRGVLMNEHQWRRREGLDSIGKRLNHLFERRSLTRAADQEQTPAEPHRRRQRGAGTQVVA